MRGLRGLGLLVSLSLGLALLPNTAVFAASCEFRYGGQAAGNTCHGELGWSYDPGSRTFRYGSVITSARASDRYDYLEVSACDANTTRPDAGIGCARAFNCPAKVDPEGTPMRAIRLVTIRKLRADPNAPWQATNKGVCHYTGRTVPMSAVVAAARLSIEKQVGRPSIIAQPPGGLTLVSFTSLFHAPPQVVTSLLITAPVSGAITATPHYTWDLGDGVTAAGAGHPYDGRIDPRSHASDDYYVKASYSSPGPKHVRLTLTWQAVISLTGYGDVPLDPIIFTEVTTTTAKTTTARLYAR